MFRNLNCGAIGVSANLEQSLDYALLGQFGGIDLPMGEVAECGADEVKRLFAEKGLQMGGIGFPANWMGSEDEWQASLEGTRTVCALAAELGATRAATWVPSWNDERPWAENMVFHVQRFQPIAAIMAEYGIRLGLEFLGPKTLRDNHTYEFIHTMDGMLELCHRIGTGNVGLLLDAWHWYTSGGTLDDLRRLNAEDVVYVHINDAPPGIPIDEQIDSVRALPGETGIIDLVGFLQALEAIGYDGPITPEPFSQKVREMPPDEAVTLTGTLLKTVWEKAGIAE